MSVEKYIKGLKLIIFIQHANIFTEAGQKLLKTCA